MSTGDSHSDDADSGSATFWAADTRGEPNEEPTAAGPGGRRSSVRARSAKEGGGRKTYYASTKDPNQAAIVDRAAMTILSNLKEHMVNGGTCIQFTTRGVWCDALRLHGCCDTKKADTSLKNMVTTRILKGVSLLLQTVNGSNEFSRRLLVACTISARRIPEAGAARRFLICDASIGSFHMKLPVPVPCTSWEAVFLLSVPLLCSAVY
jgi:hypothetical protein